MDPSRRRPHGAHGEPVRARHNAIEFHVFSEQSADRVVGRAAAETYRHLQVRQCLKADFFEGAQVTLQSGSSPGVTQECVTPAPLGEQMQRGVIEGSGAKFVCAVAESRTSILERAAIATRAAPETLAECLDFFQAAVRRRGPVSAVGIACFGPLQWRTDARDYGCLLDARKPCWSGFDLHSPLRSGMHVLLALETDVGAAAHGGLAADALIVDAVHLAFDTLALKEST